MNIIKNEKMIKRYGTMGQWISIAALVVLGTGMYISITKPQLFTYAIGALIIGFVLTQIGMYLGNRWGRSPRPDEQLDAALKGLTSDYTLYHYTATVSHLLVGPSGVWILLPYRQSGRVIFQKNRWKISGGGFMQTYMSIFGQEGIGRPDLEIEHEISLLQKLFSKKFQETEHPPIQAALIFTSNQVEIEPNDASTPAMQINKLKGFIRQKAKEKPLNALKIKEITDLFETQ